MNATRGLVIVTVSLLALTACGGEGNSDEAAPPEAPEAETETTEEAESEPTVDEDEEVEDEEEEENQAPVDTDYSDDPILGDREFTGRMTGDVMAEPGEPVEIDMGPFEEVGDYMGTLTLTELVAGAQCDSEVDEEIEALNGEWLYATFALEADDDAPSEFSISADDFRWDGFDDHITYYEAWACQSYYGGLQDPIRQGDSAERLLVFDIPNYEGTLTYRGATHYVEWEIEQDDYDNGDRIPDDSL